MILKLTYQIRFPLGAEFALDPKFIFIKNIYSSIKNILCNNQERKCKTCQKSSTCIYHLLSGKDFEYYPAIVINRKFIEQRKLTKSDELTLDFYLIGVASQYVGFIQNYFDVTKTLENQYFQKFLLEQVYLDEDEYYDGNITFSTPIRSIEDIEQMIKYYNDTYNTNIKIPIVEVETPNIPKMIDYNKYIINGHLLKYDGYKYKLNVKNFSKELFKIGIGKTACIGGGHANEN